MSASPAPASLHEVTVGDVMRPATTTVETDAHLASVAYLMKRAGDSALVVTPGDGVGGPVAVVTDAHISQAVADGRNLDETRINQLGLSRPTCVDPSMPVTDAHISQAVADGRNLDETRINQLGLSRPTCVDPSMPVTEAAELMLTDRLEHLPVVRGDRLLGLLDLAAVCRALLRYAGN